MLKEFVMNTNYKLQPIACHCDTNSCMASFCTLFPQLSVNCVHVKTVILIKLWTFKFIFGPLLFSSSTSFSRPRFVVIGAVIIFNLDWKRYFSRQQSICLMHVSILPVARPSPLGQPSGQVQPFPPVVGE